VDQISESGICDANVVGHSAVVHYAETLLMLSNQSSDNGNLRVAIGMAIPRSMLGSRISHLLNDSWIDSLRDNPKATRAIAWSVAVSTCACICFFQPTLSSGFVGAVAAGETQVVLLVALLTIGTTNEWRHEHRVQQAHVVETGELF